MRVVFLLGAGFSIPAKYPSGTVLNGKFFKRLENNILKASSGEYSWDEHGEIASHNGRLNFEYLNISYLLSELVEQFQIETNEIFDYECFYDWFLNKWGDIKFMQLCCNNVNSRINKRFGGASKHLFKDVNINQYIEINKCYNYLIADLLDRNYDREIELYQYESFINLINSAKEVDIFTLNHDLLLEYILNHYGLLFSDGFSIENSEIVGEGNKKLPVFRGSFDLNLRIHKLHGSVDYYLFNVMNQNYSNYISTGKYLFFKPGNYNNKHDAKRIDTNNGKVVQNLNSDITPQFLTGKGKIKTIKNHEVYKILYEAYEKSFQLIDKLAIIGYSFRDTHINTILKSAMSNRDFEIVNINPNMDFPFRKNYSDDFVKNLKSIKDL